MGNMISTDSRAKSVGMWRQRPTTNSKLLAHGDKDGLPAVRNPDLLSRMGSP